MSRGPQLFKERDVTKAVRAVEKAGKKVCRVEIAKDRIVIYIRSFLRFAIAQGGLSVDPTEKIELTKSPKTSGHMTWKQPQVLQYRNRHALGTIARLALELMLNRAHRARQGAARNLQRPAFLPLARATE